jgi:hypothetical protein
MPQGRLQISTPQRAGVFAALSPHRKTTIMNSDQARLRAEKSFKQKERARDGRKAMTEYDTQARTIRKQTAR